MTITPEEAFGKTVKAGKRLPELEDIMMTQLNCCYWYAYYIIMGKLPDKMHNMMILYAIKDPNHYYVKLYFNEVLKTVSPSAPTTHIF